MRFVIHARTEQIIIAMARITLLVALLLVTRYLYSQERAVGLFLSDSSMIHASVSMCIKDADSGETIAEYNAGKSLTPASVMKLITSGTALELLGPQYTFRTLIGYTGSLNKRTGRLSGNIIIRGGGDPAFGSAYFADHYGDIIERCVSEIKIIGIKRVDGMVMTDDSYFDYLPVPPKWQWEDIGNYYGAGVYGLSVFDNTIEIHLRTSSDSVPVIIKGVIPGEYSYEFKNRLAATGTSDEGYVFAAPYSHYGWLTGTVPVNRDDFTLKGSIADPPLFFAGLINEKLEAEGIKIKNEPSTTRLKGTILQEEVKNISEITSPTLAEIIEVLNHESVNLYAETLLKELGKRFRNNGSTASGTDVVKEFLTNANIASDGMFMEDGSGLSRADGINSEELTNFLAYMKNRGKYFTDYFKSLPEAGKEGTLKSHFTDPVFGGRLHAKSGSMERVRCYAGYFTTNSHRNMVFSILVNNFTGPSQRVVSGIEEIIREIILYR
jgi:serine-type D-Ala-D-Ala carboxypeptidase/endopeptidase (penicillin-binding protein 4)